MAALSRILALLFIGFSAISFGPQLTLLWISNSSAGLSPLCTLFNLVLATEQLTLGLQGILIEPHSFLHEQLKAGLDDWLNVVQLTTVWICHVFLFALVLWLPPISTKQKLALSTAYLVYITFSLAFVAYETTLQEDDGSDWGRALFSGVHLIFVNLVVNALAVLGLLTQIRATRSVVGPRNVSVFGLAVQAVVFLVVGISWIFRLRIPRGSFDVEPGLPQHSLSIKLIVWYQTVGWATVGNLIFALIQGILFVVIRRDAGPTGESGTETAPLLREL
ncbi:uncharacterized protein RHO25_007250 [Cercospora beticola]|uniref:Uncharacterized protein n=1 Tax=Cercospora beticola TaxID=122368 RepID=A0ABZ0NT44_CERBT|nr:hypothetical protein RHO25_007250 [Cercospora beticola]